MSKEPLSHVYIGPGGVLRVRIHVFGLRESWYAVQGVTVDECDGFMRLGYRLLRLTA
jgi:hypothetical protein